MTEDSTFYFSVADQLIMERGEYDPIEFLIGAGLLEEDDYREWHRSGAGQLRSLLLDDVDVASTVLRQTQAYLLEQGLAKQPVDIALRTHIGGSDVFVELCCTRLQPASTQTDLFHDTPVRVAENTIQAALGEHNIGAAREAIDALRRLHGAASTADYERLLAGFECPDEDPVGYATKIERVLGPLAVRSLGHHAQRYLGGLWFQAARKLVNVGFVREVPHAHASHGYVQARRWREVVACISAETDWQQHPVLVLRFAEAHARLGAREAARRAWSLLCWQHPDVAADVLARAPGDPIIARYWREFADVEPELPVRDFPGWLLMADARQRDYVPALLAPEDEVGVVYAAMSRLVTQPNDMEARARASAQPELAATLLAPANVSDVTGSDPRSGRIDRGAVGQRGNPTLARDCRVTLSLTRPTTEGCRVDIQQSIGPPIQTYAYVRSMLSYRDEEYATEHQRRTGDLRRGDRLAE